MNTGRYIKVEDIPPSFLHDRLKIVEEKYQIVDIKVAKDGVCLAIKGKLSKRDIRSILKCITPDDISVPRKLMYERDYEGCNFIDYGGTNDIEDSTLIFSLDGIDYRQL